MLSFILLFFRRMELKEKFVFTGVMAFFFGIIACAGKPAVKDAVVDPLTVQQAVLAENMNLLTPVQSLTAYDPKPTRTAGPTSTATPTPIFVITPSKNENWMEYYPTYPHDVWYFKGYKKAGSERKFMKVKAEILGIENKDGKDYYYFYAPKVEIRYLMRKDEGGVYMRVIKYPFPIFDFSIEVNITPEMPIIKFPIKIGDKWVHKARAEATLFGFLKLGRNIQSDFEVLRKEMLHTEAGNVEAYHIKVLVDEGDGKTRTTEKYWYGKGTGYTYSDTTGHDAFLVGYRFYDEKIAKWREKIPKDVEQYE
jgi:hypothetical protein